jgi:predicted MFS family arabinose efflux permease
MLAATGALIADVIPVSRRTEGIGYYGMAATAAVAVAPAIGLAVYRFGWLALMLELSALALLLLWMATRVREGAATPGLPSDPAATGVPARQEPPRLREALSWRVVASAGALFLVALPYGGITSYAALFATERAIAPRSLFFTVFALTVLVTRVVLPPLVDRGTRPERLLLSSLLLVPPGLVLLARAETRGGLVLAAIVFAAGFGSAYPSFMTWVLARTDARHRAATFGGVLFAFDTAIGGGSLLVGLLGDALGLDRAFLALAAVSALAVPCFLLTRRLLPALAGAAREHAAGAPANQP